MTDSLIDPVDLAGGEGRVLDKAALDQLFLGARSQQGFLEKPVAEETLRTLYGLLRWGPTSMNLEPARFVFVVSPEAKAKLEPCLAEGNRAKTMGAPVTVIIAQDLDFHEILPDFNAIPNVREKFADKPDVRQKQAFHNSTLQGAYLIMAARALGLDCGPMGGFDNQMVDDAFLAGTSWRSNFLCNLGYGDPAKLRPRAGRPSFDAACSIV